MEQGGDECGAIPGTDITRSASVDYSGNYARLVRQSFRVSWSGEGGRKSRVAAKVVKDTTGETLKPNVQQYVEVGS